MQPMVIGKCSNASLLDVPTSSGTSLVSILNMVILVVR